MALRTEREKCAHLLRRFGLGASEAELDYYLQGGLKGAIDRLVNFENTDEGFSLDVAELANAKNKVQMPQITGWWILRMMETRRPLQEKMTLFWHNHFATSAEKVKVPMDMFQQNEILRRNAVGNFKTLLSEVSKDPAMLLWLDNQYNVRGKPNENFAREVMELFTLGIGHYTEKDIQESARAYTGWSVGGKPGPKDDPKNLGRQFVYRPRLHDDGTKTFFGKSGEFTGDDILDMLCKMPRTAEFIAGKVWTFFAYPNPEPAVLQRISHEFKQSGLDIKTLILAIMESPEFYSEKAERAIYKNPVEFTVATARQLGLGSIMSDNMKAQGFVRGQLAPIIQVGQSMKGMGMQLFYPPDVAGWDQGQSWITTATMVERIGWADRLFGGQRVVLRIDPFSIFKDDPTPRGVATTLVSVFDAPIAEDKLEKLVAAAEKATEGKLTQANAGEAARAVARLIFATPEFQFC